MVHKGVVGMQKGKRLSKSTVFKPKPKGEKEKQIMRPQVKSSLS